MDQTIDPADPFPGKPAVLEACRLVRLAGNRPILDEVSLEICGGDRLAVVGPTGSGKSVLLRALALLDPTDQGSVLWRGCVIDGNNVPEFRSRVVYLHQRPAMVEGTVEDNLRQPFALRIHRQKQFSTDLLQSWLAALDRDMAFLAKQQRDLSGGESQIVALLRAMQLEPEILLLDEPTAALDSQATQSVEQLVETWLGERPGERAVVWVTHDRRQAERVADRVLSMRDGSLR